MKVLHTADIHLGAKFKGISSSVRLRKQLQDTFTKIIDLAINENVDLILISGDLFDSPRPSSQLIDFVCNQFQRINTPICLVPGTHESELYHRLDVFHRIPNLTLFLDTEWRYKEYPNLNTTVYGINPQEKHPLKLLAAKTSSLYHIALLHASYFIPGKTDDDIMFTSDEISSSGMNYIALGHWHSIFNCTQKNVLAWYPGAPEPVAIDEDGAGNIILIDEMKPEIYKIGSTKCEEMEIDITGMSDLTVLKERISTSADQNLRCRVNLKGVSSLTLGLDLKQLEEELIQGFSQLKIVDKSIIPKEAVDPHTYIHKPFIKRFLELMQEEINNCSEKDRQIAEQALRYGLALLEGKEVL